MPQGDNKDRNSEEYSYVWPNGIHEEEDTLTDNSIASHYFVYVNIAVIDRLKSSESNRSNIRIIQVVVIIILCLLLLLSSRISVLNGDF